MDYQYRATPNPNVNIETIGDHTNNSHTIVTIDNVMQRPEELIHLARNNTYFQPVRGKYNFYPGKRDHAPSQYTQALTELLIPIIKEVYSDNTAAEDFSSESYLSLVSLKPDELTIYQRIPHFDSTKPNQYAVVHYFSGKELGGTNFYRYRPTGTIEVTDEQMPKLAMNIQQQLMQAQAEHSGYITESTTLFEKVHSVEAQVNRLVIYKSNIFHAGDLHSEQCYSGDISTGRFSVNTFLKTPETIS